MHNRIEWEEGIECLVNPEDGYYNSFFTRKWDRQMIEKIFPPRGGIREFYRTCRASLYLIREKLERKWRKRPQPLTLNEYLERRNSL